MRGRRGGRAPAAGAAASGAPRPGPALQRRWPGWCALCDAQQASVGFALSASAAAQWPQSEPIGCRPALLTPSVEPWPTPARHIRLLLARGPPQEAPKPRPTAGFKRHRGRGCAPPRKPWLARRPSRSPRRPAISRRHWVGAAGSGVTVCRPTAKHGAGHADADAHVRRPPLTHPRVHPRQASSGCTPPGDTRIIATATALRWRRGWRWPGWRRRAGRATPRRLPSPRDARRAAGGRVGGAGGYPREVNTPAAGHCQTLGPFTRVASPHPFCAPLATRTSSPATRASPPALAARRAALPALEK